MNVRSYIIVCVFLALASSRQTCEAQNSAADNREGTRGRLFDRLRNRAQGENPSEASPKKGPTRQDLGKLIEMGDTQRLFTSPREERTEAYITGRFG